MASLIIGFGLGAVRLVAELNKDELTGWLYIYADINFLHFAALLFVICAAVLVVGSLSAPPHSDAQLAGLTYATTAQARAALTSMRGADRRWQQTDRWLTVLLVALVALVWLYFTG